ncbi:MAG: LamG-like jellyroll fold domain-containing protein [Salibacteraceae bacterium]
MKTFVGTFILLLSSILLIAQEPGSGYGITFDGSNDHITIPNTTSTTPGTQLTFEAWVKPDASQVTNLVMKGNYGWGILIGATGCTSGLKLNYWVDNTCTNSITSTGSLTAGEWNHVAVVVTTSPSKSLAFFINGVAAGTSTSSTITIGNGSSGALYLGSQGSGCACNYFDGSMDEVRLWNDALTQTEIQTWMCKKVTSSHTSYSDLGAYYKMDASSGTSLTDSENSNTGTLINGPTRTLSGAAIGDESTNSFGNGNSTSVTVTHSDGSFFKADNFTGTPDGAQVYLVNEAPNSTTESLSGALESTRYYGTFVVGGTSPTHTVTHDYTGNTNITGGTESQAVLTSRADNSTSSWTKESNSNQVDVSTDVITKCSESSNKEYAAGFDDELQERPGSGYALDFDGTNDYVDLGDNIEGLSAITIEAWIYNQGNNTWNEISSKQHVNAFSLNATNDKLWFHLGDGSAWFAGGGLASNSTIPENVWTHVAVTWDGTTAKMYINGVLDLSSAHTGTMGSNSNSRGIGNRPGGTSLQFKGKMDEIRIWSTALSQTEIQNWMCQKVNSSHTDYCNLAAYYRFDENTGTTLYDYTGNVNGTLTNGPTYALSGAAIGDESTSSYSSGNSTTVTETHSDGSSFKIDNFTGTPDGAHVYLVNEAPNSTTETLSGALESTRYYGTYVVGGTSPTHSVTYDYTGNTNITGGTESLAVLASRAENATSSWTKLTNSFDLNTSTDVISECNVSTNQEYAGGFDAVLQERPGSGYALNFDGSNDYVDGGSSIASGLDDFTMECWMYFDGGSNQWFLSFDQGGDYTERIQIEVHLGAIYFGWQSTSNSTAWTSFSGGTIASSTWYHIAVTNSSSSGKQIYVNGKLEASNASTLSPSELSGTVKFDIGRLYHSSNNHYFDGQLDEVRVWNKVLSAAEIQANMCKKVTSTDANYCNLVSYYRFDENTGTTLTDYAGGNNGTLTNGPTYALSGAAIGDESAYSYGNGNSTSVTETHTDGSSFKIDNFTGTPDGAHVYLVNEAPNSTTETLSGTLESTRYYGTFVVGGTSPTHSVTYDYTGNTNITGGTETETKLTTRADNSATSWTTETSYFDLDQSNNAISKCGQSSNKEYAAGFDNTTLQERPGSGYALTYDGTNDYVVTSDIPELANASAVTYEAWIYIPGSSWDDYATILSKEAGSGNRVQLVLSGGSQGGTNDIIAVVGDVSNNMNLNTNSDVIPYNTWTHVAMVFDGSLTGDANRLKIYVNGIQQTGLATAGSGSVPATTPNTTADFYIGSRGTSLYYPGSLDEVRVWNKALSETELRNNMCKKITSSDANYCNLAAYYRFDENTGSTLYDYAGGINGTLTNGPVYTLSGAPLGDNVTFATSVTSSTTLSLAHADGPQMNVDVTSGTADLLALYRIDEAPNVTTPPSGLTEVSHSHYYGVKAFGSSSLVYEVEYNYNGHDRLIPEKEDSLKLCARADNSTSSWTLENATLNTTSNTLTLGGQTGTQFIMGSANQFPLPVDLIFFTVNLQDDVVQLNWATASELNSDYFLVQKSLDGKSWKNLERVGAQGNSNQEVHYGISDFELVPNKIYYRLVQVDLDGKSHHYPIQSIWNDGKSGNNVSRVYPNPTKGILILSSNDIDLSYAKIINSMGNQWSAIDLVSDKVDNQVTFDISSFPQGQYVLLVGENSYRFVKE